MGPATAARASWRLRSVDAALVERLARSLGLPEVVARVLALRGHVEPAAISAHLEASVNALWDPGLLPGMQPACERLARAVAGGETILVHGDYDVDGVCGTALLVELFRLLDARCVAYIPRRLSDGYSFGPHSVARARECGAGLVVSVDNGTSAQETIEALAALSIDTVVTDHHEPPEGPDGLPPAVALVNPKLPGSAYPFRELCGSGVAFKLAWGLCQHVSGARRVRDDLKTFLAEALAFVALATVCDVVPLVGENRVLARAGLRALAASRRPGLRALISSAGLKARTLSAQDVAFKLGPRLNAAGRLGSAELALELLTSRDEARAAALSAELERLNEERRRIEAEVLAGALEAAEPYADPAEHPVLVLAAQGWHQGVVGIVAARLAERFARPALVIGLCGAEGRGSARSVRGFDVLAALRGGARHMLRFGGHAAAAGCEVSADEVDALRAAVCARAAELLGTRRAPEPGIEIDGQLSLELVGPELMGHIDRLEPFGLQNEAPVLLALDARLAEPPRVVGSDKSHLLLRVRRGARVLKAMAFGLSQRAGELALGAPLHLVYTPRWSTFRGATQLELLLHDFAVGPRPQLSEA